MNATERTAEQQLADARDWFLANREALYRATPHVARQLAEAIDMTIIDIPGVCSLDEPEDELRGVVEDAVRKTLAEWHTFDGSPARLTSTGEFTDDVWGRVEAALPTMVHRPSEVRPTNQSAQREAFESLQLTRTVNGVDVPFDANDPAYSVALGVGYAMFDKGYRVRRAEEERR
ncbi:hypothetical protein [Leifsonia sp. Leaf264]|uniref:hypothetical protein n=1 Tax=Leifsonia sp. Leaf264 TaxID=1736314 RepID=UPI0006F73546|nr:hypothetical protein [Leifsonia sp. Leaf264]KQO98570.1 hypothetical protein ASF30_10945 [Leifsonia sp. Leaf264]